MRLLLLSSLAILPGAAAAHAILLASDPPPQATVAPGPAELVLRYNSRIDPARSRLTLRHAGSELVLPIEPGRPTDTLAARAPLAAGDYVLHWQVLAVDGHITRGDLRFSVQK